MAGNVTIKMKALKRFHYPSGPTGRDYQEGDEVEVASERDARALRLLRVARDPETPQARKETEPERSVPRRDYKRRDMQAEETKPMTTAQREAARLAGQPQPQKPTQPQSTEVKPTSTESASGILPGGGQKE